MFGANVVGAEEAQERRSFRGGFYGGAAVGFFALHDADYGNDGHAGFLSGLDGVDGGGAGGADVVHDDDARAFAKEAFNATAGSVLLFGFAHEKSVNQGSAGFGLGAPGAVGSNVADDRIGAHGESADSFSFNLVFKQEIENGFAGEASALGVERGGAAVDVVVAGAARGELELAEFEAGAGEKREQLLGVSGHHW